MNFFDLKDEQLFNSLADAVEPIITICQSEKIGDILKEKKGDNGISKVAKAKIVVVILRDFQPEAKQVLAAVNGVPVEEFECTFMTLSKGIMEILNNKEITDFFMSLLKTMKSFGDVMENTEDKED